MKKKLIICGLLAFFAVAIVWGLAYSAGKYKRLPNGFTRRGPQQRATPLHSLDLGYNSFYIAGISGDKIFLGNSTAPLTVLVTDSLFSKIDTVHITGMDVLMSGKLTIDSGHFFLTDRKQRAIYTGDISNWQVTAKMHTRSFFDVAIFLSRHTLIVRTFKESVAEYTLAKENTTDTSLSFFPSILQKQGDGVFSNDGMLQYDARSSKLVYIYFYRNEFIVLDTNLTVLSRHHTIDTCSTAKIEVSPVLSEHALVISKNPDPVNRKSCVFNNKIYILSSLAADNENYDSFAEQNVADIYSLQTGKYMRTIYLPVHKGQKIKNMRLLGEGTLVAISGDYLVSYRVPG